MGIEDSFVSFVRGWEGEEEEGERRGVGLGVCGV